MLKLFKYIVYKNVSSPIYLIHFVTSRCNANCPHCFISINQNNKINNDLTLEEIEKITQSFSSDIFNVNLTGGEPFLRDDLSQIVKLYRKNAEVKSFLIATNGFFVERIIEAIKTILYENKDIKLTISLSLDQIGDKYDKLRGLKGLYNRVIALYKQLSVLDPKRLSVQTNLTIQQDNHEDVEYILDHLIFAEKIRNFNATLIRGDSKNKMASAINYDNYFKINRLINKYLALGYMSGFENSYLRLLNAKNQISRRLIEKTVKNKRFISTCFAGSLTAVLYPNGDIYPCELSKEKIGNIRDFNYNFKSLWTCSKAYNIRKKIIMDKCFCTHECNWTINILFNPRYLLELIIRFIINNFKKVKNNF